ncbi:MAG: hypothetical protein ABWY93_26310 [Mycobacterium sp.]
MAQNADTYAELPSAQHMFNAFPSMRTAAVVAAVDRFLTHIGQEASASGQDNLRMPPPRLAADLPDALTASHCGPPTCRDQPS